MSELPKHLTLSHKSKAQVSWQPFWACFYQGSKVQMLLQFPWLSLYTCTRDIFFLHFPCRSSQETAKILTTTDSASCSPEELKPASGQGKQTWCNCSIPPSGKIDGVGAKVKLSGQLGPERSWMLQICWASLAAILMNKPSRELGVIYNTAQCKLCDTDHSDSCGPGGFSPAAQEPGKTPKLFYVCTNIKGHFYVKYEETPILLFSKFGTLPLKCWLF